MRPVGRYAESVGIEVLAVDGTDCPAGGCLVSVGQGFGCWVKNVTVRQAQNRLIGLDGSLQCKSRTASLPAERPPRAPTGAALPRHVLSLPDRGQHHLAGHGSQRRIGGQRLRLQLLR